MDHSQQHAHFEQAFHAYTITRSSKRKIEFFLYTGLGRNEARESKEMAIGLAIRTGNQDIFLGPEIARSTQRKCNLLVIIYRLFILINQELTAFFRITLFTKKCK